MTRLLLAACLLPLTTAAHAGDLTVEVANVRNNAGDIVLAVCDQPRFMGDNCPHIVRVPAQQGVTKVHVGAVAAGRWAVQLFHDENRNDELDENWLGLPKEGVGLSNDPTLMWGKPSFEECAFPVGQGAQTVTVTVVYFL